jgi:intracellular septation protein
VADDGLHKSIMSVTQRQPPRWLQPAVDYGPLAIFFLTYVGAGLMAATAAIVAASLIALALAWTMQRRVPFIPLLTAAVVAVFGGLTLWLRDETFIKMKPTIVQALFAAILLGGLVFDRPLLKPLLGRMMPPMSDAAWRRSRCVTRSSSSPWGRSTRSSGAPSRPTSG